MPVIITPIVNVTWLKCCRVFWRFCYAGKVHNIYLILLSSLYEISSAFISANNTGSLINTLLVLKSLIPVPSFTSFLWFYSGGISGILASFSALIIFIFWKLSLLFVCFKTQVFVFTICGHLFPFIVFKFLELICLSF